MLLLEGQLRQFKLVHQFVNALSEGPVKFHYPAVSVAADFGPVAAQPGRGARS